jgi:hypothetical protein
MERGILERLPKRSPPVKVRSCRWSWPREVDRVRSCGLQPLRAHAAVGERYDWPAEREVGGERQGPVNFTR